MQVTRYNTPHDLTLIASDKNKLLRGKQPAQPEAEAGEGLPTTTRSGKKSISCAPPRL